MALTMEAVVTKYLALRDKRTQLKKDYTAEDDKYLKAMELSEAWLLKQLDLVGGDNISIKGLATVMRSKDMKVSSKDWQVFNAWAAANNQMEMFERRISRTVLKAYMEEHNDDVPPSLDIIFEKTVNVRRAPKGE